MDAGYISAMTALAGSMIGALASIATTWVIQHSQTRATQRAQDRARCEALYGKFIREAFSGAAGAVAVEAALEAAAVARHAEAADEEEDRREDVALLGEAEPGGVLQRLVHRAEQIG